MLARTRMGVNGFCPKTRAIFTFAIEDRALGLVSVHEMPRGVALARGPATLH